MPGAIFFVVIVAIGVVIAAATGTIFLLVPFVVIALGAVLVPVALGAMRGTRAEPGAAEGGAAEGAGMPSTSEASYQPVQQPRQP
jgi:hypothetical protein